jgi:hypothetical protein
MPSRKATPQEKIKRAFRNKTGARLTFEDVKTLLDNASIRDVIYGEDWRDYYQDQRVEVSAQDKEGEE